MAANGINDSVLLNFIIKTVGGDKITSDTAQKYDISEKTYAEANTDENDYVGLDEILQSADLRQLFQSKYVDEVEQKRESKDKEEEKKEQSKVQDKNEAGI